MNQSLPIWQIHSSIIGELKSGNRLVLVAPTGSGKTTQVPQMLLDAGLAGEKKIVVLQPRRVAARTVAARVAWERNGKLGGEVGYQIRFDDQTSLGTRICFVTEGILLRWLQDDRTLADVRAVLFDEFHERNLLSDVSLALVKQIQQTQRPDLKMVVMSATLDAEPVAKYLENSFGVPPSGGPAPEPPEGGTPNVRCPILISEGQSFNVKVNYLDSHDERPFTEQAADTVERIVNSGDPGDILVFMPGMGEINATINGIRAAKLNERVALISLHGELQPDEQDLAFSPHPLRKIVVATNVAETSVTIDGILHVVDSGQARVARYDSERGIGTLFLEEISRASADQRKGRAGRTAPGTCHRLWTESGHLNRPERNTPEIQRSDLAEIVLLLHSLGIKRAAQFDWLDKPDLQAVERAEKLLHTLGALRDLRFTNDDLRDETCELVNRKSPIVNSDLTPIGRQMLRLPMHPRYSRMLVEASKRGCVRAAALCAALVSGRDLLQRVRRDEKHISEARELFEASQDSDFFTMMRAYQFAKKNHFAIETCRRYGINAQAAKQVEQTFDQISRLAERLWGEDRGLKIEDGKNARDAADSSSILHSPSSSDDPLLHCILAGFVDQLCMRRDQGTLDCDLLEGRTGTLVRESVVQNSKLFVAASIREVPGRGAENLTLLGLTSMVKREWIEEMFPEQLTTKIEHLFDRTHKRVAAVKLIRFHDLVVNHEHQRDVEPAASGRCLGEAYRKQYFELPLLNHEVKQFIARVNLVAAVSPELDFPAFDENKIVETLAKAFDGLTLVKEAQATPLKDIFHAQLAPEQREWLNELAPLAVAWPGDKKSKLLYPEEPRDQEGEPNSPELQLKLHECFAAKNHPHLCEGKLAVKIWLCSPDGKRIESTFNWPAFRTNSYPKLKSALQKKFPAVLWV
ncbi:MAG: ATP-dependent helicase C-terminal domain-containing protein [Verrucomicrobiota bacterium]